MQSLIPEQNRSGQERSMLFLMLALGILFMMMWQSAQQNRQIEEQARKREELIDQPIKSDDKPAVKKEPQLNPDNTPVQVAETKVPSAFVSLGSLAPKSPYRVLVTLTNQGAAIARLELNSNKYRDVQETSGYLGQIVADVAHSDQTAAENGGGVIVQVVGDGTPAKQFGLEVGDRIFRLTQKSKQGDITTAITDFTSLRNILLKTKPREQIELTFDRQGQKHSQTVTLGRYPIDIIRPESIAKDYDEYKAMGGLRGVNFKGGGDFPKSDQLSFLTSLQSVDDNKLDWQKILNATNSTLGGIVARDDTVDIELPNVTLRKECWEVQSQAENEVVFRRTIPEYKLEMRKTYSLVKVENPIDKDNFANGYELSLKIEVQNLDNDEHKVSYQLDGPTGLPLEGAWYSLKTGPGWFGYGLRDIVVRFQGNKGQTVDNKTISEDKIGRAWIDDPLDYIGVDSKYFQCTLKPNKPADEKNAWHVRSFPIRVGERNTAWYCLTNVSFRLLSRETTLQPNETLSHSYS
ncbi:MAG: hypothetical protein FWE67_07380, partial [Planctomycetaceae bacterium]|nr:hypothetical protein [Planctomycetaceae bacterium]